VNGGAHEACREPAEDVGARSPARTAPPGLGLGYPRMHLRRTDSTNDRARELALRGAPHGTLVTAAEQSAGRGRQGRRWSAPAGSSLLMSIVLRQQPSAPLPLASLPLLAAVALCDAVGPDARIKWPNDVLLDGRKLAGILVEGRPQQGWAVLGIGVNVAVRIDDLPASLGPTAATLGRDPDAIEPFLAELLAALEARLRQPTAEVLEAWRERDALRGREIAWSGGRGHAASIDGEGRLVVDLADGSRTALTAGEVHLENAP
jgi:BirA family biotin operon repressor/biotin-[acetyl-CoA-carboxylase] ligase